MVEVLKKKKITYLPIDLSAKEEWYYNESIPALKRNQTMVEEQILDKNSSVIITCLNPDPLRSLVLAAKRTGMLDTGQFVFFTFDLGITNTLAETYKPWLDENASKAENIEAREAFSSVLTVRAGGPRAQTENFTRFSQRVKEIAREEFSYDYTEDVSLTVAKFYDAALLYTSALFSLIEDEGDVENSGEEMTRRMRGRHGKSIEINGIDSNIIIDDNGDRMDEYSIMRLEAGSEEYRPVLVYSAHHQNLTLLEEMRWPVNCSNSVYRLVVARRKEGGIRGATERFSARHTVYIRSQV